MAESTAISWADATFNPWIGCTKVSEACRNCYAEGNNSFRKWNGGTWGPGAPRKVTSEANWRKPLQWNHRAILDGVRPRVFTASLADIFDAEAPPDAQIRLFDLIEECSALDWLVLTKRPENAKEFLSERYGDTLPSNLWLGTSIESADTLRTRGPVLLSIPAVVRFYSMEPLLGAVDLSTVRHGADPDLPMYPEWVITGGESGPNARPSHPDWFRSLRDQCVAAGVPFHFKQWGAWAPPDESAGHRVFDYVTDDGRVQIVSCDGSLLGKPWPGWKLDYPTAAAMRLYSKRAAGRLLDGREWNEFPSMRKGPVNE